MFVISPNVVAATDVVSRLTAEGVGVVAVTEADLLILTLLHFKLGISRDVLKYCPNLIFFRFRTIGNPSVLGGFSV